ncbi:MAG: hypothetical protein M5U26_03005 [Planctomycetota bacterium]|nr:hypothetical protein [Planctomycetota bacterium]
MPAGAAVCAACGFPLAPEIQARLAEARRVELLASFAQDDPPGTTRDRVAYAILALGWPGLAALTPFAWLIFAYGLLRVAVDHLRGRPRRAREYALFTLLGLGLFIVGSLSLQPW